MRKGFLTSALVVAFVLSGCAAKQDEVNSCSDAPGDVGAGSSGKALIFSPDPAMSAQNPGLSPKANLDPFRSEVQLDHLAGNGVLQGQYVEARTNIGCPDSFGANDSKNDFEYSQKDPHFQEAMAYYYGDHYQTALDDLGIEVAPEAIHILAHCSPQDNAYYTIVRMSDGSVQERVCLGDSLMSPGSFYADDAYVTIHELQHATTARHYSLTRWMGEFPYDEAGALNEGLSDFMTLMYLAPLVPTKAGFDPKLFSGWALGKFGGSANNDRGAYKCPMYDPSWPTCESFPEFSSTGHVSYVYPDGLGWPFAQANGGSPTSGQVFANFSNQEEIHNNAVIIEGALWDAYKNLEEANGSKDDQNPEVQNKMMRLVVKAIEDLPKPDSQNLSPVNFREFAASVVHVAKAMNLESNEVAAITEGLQTRGLLTAPLLDKNWAAPSANGLPTSPGIFVVSESNTMKSWLQHHGADPSIVNGSNSMHALSPGKSAVIWFNVENESKLGQSAGAVNLTVTSKSPSVSFDQRLNRGWISSSKVQIQYAKINGSSMIGNVENLANRSTVAGENYFQTNPHFAFTEDSSPNFTTGIWVQVASGASHGDTVEFQAEAKPSNGAASVVTFHATIQ